MRRRGLVGARCSEFFRAAGTTILAWSPRTGAAVAAARRRLTGIGSGTARIEDAEPTRRERTNPAPERLSRHLLPGGSLRRRQLGQDLLAGALPDALDALVGLGTSALAHG